MNPHCISRRCEFYEHKPAVSLDGIPTPFTDGCKYFCTSFGFNSQMMKDCFTEPVGIKAENLTGYYCNKFVECTDNTGGFAYRWLGWVTL